MEAMIVEDDEIFEIYKRGAKYNNKKMQFILRRISLFYLARVKLVAFDYTTSKSYATNCVSRFTSMSVLNPVARFQYSVPFRGFIESAKLLKIMEKAVGSVWYVSIDCLVARNAWHKHKFSSLIFENWDDGERFLREFK